MSVLPALAVAAAHDDLANNLVSVRVGVTTPAIPLTLSAPTGSSSPALLYDQNSNSKFGVGLDYSWFGFFVSVDDLQSEIDPDTYGSASYSDFQLHSYMGPLGIDFYLQDFKGYYLANTKEVTGDECCVLRPDLRSRFLGVNILYVLHPDRVSLASTGSLLGVQQRSGGSWMIFAGASAQELSSDAVLAPVGYVADYGILGDAKSARLTTGYFGGGYGYTGMLAGSIFFHISGLVGFGPQHQEIKTASSGHIDQWTAANKSSIRSALGWSGRRTFAGVNVIFDSTNFQLKEEVLSFNSVLTFLSAGIRFGI